MADKPDVFGSVINLSRAMRRGPIHRRHSFPHAVERMLVVLLEHEGETQRDLCDIMDIRPSSMSEMLVKMEEKEMIVRSSKEDDKRTVQVFLTEAGRKTAEEVQRRHEGMITSFSACFSKEEARMFVSLCEKLCKHLETLPREDLFDGKHPHRRPL